MSRGDLSEAEWHALQQLLPPARGRRGRPPLDRRTLLGLSQEKLARAIGLTFQQVQKYERDTNRVGPSRLYQLAKVLGMPVSFFFDDMPPEVSGKAPGLAEAAERLGEGPMIVDAAKGAALGAAGGAIAGDAGKGAAIGALTTTLFGGIKRSSRQQQEQAWRQQQQAEAQYQQQQAVQQYQMLRNEYNRAYAACMTARQYQVQ